MRFGKEFVSKMIPEWQEAYIDYAYLKTILQDIQTSRKISVSNNQIKPSFARNLTRRYNRDISVSDNNDIVVNTVTQSDDHKLVTTYETAFLKTGEPGGDSEVVFFRTLDREFNKVNSFYMSKVETARNEALALTKQMDALIAFRLRVMEKKSTISDSVSVDINALTSEIGSSSKSKEHKVALGDLMRNEEATNESILERIRMNKTRETPLSAIKTILKAHKQEEELKFTRENLKKVEERLQIAFIEFYKKLGHLKNYSFLNTSAISKILKKYDKIAARNAEKLYMEMVDSSYLTSSDEVHKLMLKTESTVIEHFCNSNRRQGMNLLRPKTNKERHRITFSTGFFFGCAISLIVALALIIHARNIMGTPGQRTYMETMFPLYRFFGFVVLHMIMYAANIYFWRIYRVNYSFIFGFKQGTELGYRHVLLISFGLGTLSLCAVLLNLDMEMDSQTKDYRTVTELIPLFLLALVIAITLCPFNILYRSSRFFFLAVLFRCVAAPFYTVNLPDFFLADQLTSQVQALRSLEFYICYYGFGDFRRRQRNTCRSNDIFTTFYFIVAVIPYWLRFLQCIRRIVEDKDLRHGYNAMKYLLTIVAACLRTAYTLNRGSTWNITAWVFMFFGFVVLHVIMYAANIYFWRIYRVNYSFIFGFKQGTELGYRHVLLISFGLGTLSLCAVLLNLDMEMDSQTKDYRTVTELIPLFLLALVIAITLCPFNILYRSSRFFFLTVLFRCIAAPFYTVNLPDFFLADQLTSQVQALRSLEFYICYYGFGDFRRRQRNTCRSNDIFTTFYFIVAVIPYWLRFLQCIRRIVEDKDLRHGYNAIKYLLTIVAACLRTAYTLNRGSTWNITAWVFSGVATLYATYWDIVVDWGLLQRGCKNSFLRDKLLVPHKTVYYAAMVLNVLLRLVWLQTVLDLKFSFLHRETLVALLACLEIIRRGIWNFFRLENEHLNNVGKFRAFKSVPLPFNYQEDRDQDN